MDEFWIAMIDYEDTHEVSSLGAIRGLRRGRVLKPSYGRNAGYQSVTLRHLGARSCTRVDVHRAVALSFLGPGPHACHWCGEIGEWATGGDKRPGLRVDHLDRNPANNAAVNLVPACNACNTSRSRLDRIMPGEPVVKSSTTHDRLTRAERRQCEQCGTEFLHMKAKRNPNKGRFCSKSCSNRWRWQNGNIGPAKSGHRT